MELKYSTSEEITKSINTVRNAYRSGKSRDVKFRKSQLNAIIKMIDENDEFIAKCLLSDLSKPRYESYCCEIDHVKNAAMKTLTELNKWTEEDYKKKATLNMLDKIFTVSHPFGVVLIIGAWNYPIFLTLLPVIGAIAAGNCVILKPSEVAESVAAFLREMIPRYLDQDCIQVVSGGVEQCNALLNEKMDYIFFTGSKNVGRIVYESAARFLTPVTLELGGKCPVFIDDNVKHMDLVVKRILYGKCMNSGQTCVAPDFVLCSAEIQDKFVATAKRVLKDMFVTYDDYARIINLNHFRRIERLLNETSGKIAVGGKMDASSKFIEPTIVVDVTVDDSLMSEEIFGPILSIIVIKDSDEAIEVLRTTSEPLVIYLFTESQKTINKFLEETTSGSLVCNETILQLMIDKLPFGGIGESGIGRYFGKYTFDTFSYERAVMIRSSNLLLEALNAVRYPPYNEKNLSLARNALKNYESKIPIDFSMIPNAISFFITSFTNSFKKVFY